MNRIRKICLLLAALVGPAAAQAQEGMRASPPDSGTEPATSQGWYTTRPYIGLSADGVEIAQFSELADIKTRAKPPTIVLKRGKAKGRELQAWHEAVRMGDMAAARKSASLVMYDYDGKPVARYHLENAWPSKIEIGGLKAGSSEVLMETVTLVCEDIQRVSP
ncbi:MAG TPA: phage tail protein [Gemmatimonadota bacterium]|nr:phage tail protein [Gemmatimonadota bacterium]